MSAASRRRHGLQDPDSGGHNLGNASAGRGRRHRRLGVRVPRHRARLGSGAGVHRAAPAGPRRGGPLVPGLGADGGAAHRRPAGHGHAAGRLRPYGRPLRATRAATIGPAGLAGRAAGLLRLRGPLQRPGAPGTREGRLPGGELRPGRLSAPGRRRRARAPLGSPAAHLLLPGEAGEPPGGGAPALLRHPPGAVRQAALPAVGAAADDDVRAGQRLLRRADDLGRHVLHRARCCGPAARESCGAWTSSLVIAVGRAAPQREARLLGARPAGAAASGRRSWAAGCGTWPSSPPTWSSSPASSSSSSWLTGDRGRGQAPGPQRAAPVHPAGSR